MLSILKAMFSKRINIVSSFLVGLFMAIFMISIPHIVEIQKILKLFNLLDGEFWVSVRYLLQTSFSVMGILGSIIFVLFIIAVSLNTVVFVIYLKRYKKRVQGVGAHLSFWGTVLAVFGTGCLSCSVLLLAPITSLLGISFATWLVYNSVLVSLAGLLLVLVSLYLLLKKLNDPDVCEIYLS